MRLIAAMIFLALAFSKNSRAQDNDSPVTPPTRDMSVGLFNQKDFTGWKFVMKDNTDPLKTWSITNGIIHCTGKATGYLRTAQVYSNYFLTVVWRFVKTTPQADDTGIFVHIQPPDKIWPQCVQVQGRHGHQGDLILMGGATAKETRGKNASTTVPLPDDPVEVTVGEWNKAETICIHNKVECFMNSKFVNEISGCTLNSGYIGIQSEGGEFEIRSIDYTPLKY